MNIIELALTTYAESNAMQADAADDHLEEARAEFLRMARSCASSTLAADAGKLDWQYTPADGLPEDAEEARALLAPGRLEYLRYRIDHAQETVSFALVQPCLACGHDRINDVTSLFHLGQLLDQGDDQHPAVDVREEPADSVSGPLAGIETLKIRAACVARLARRLLAEHPEAGLTVQFASGYGHQDGGGNSELHLKAASLEAALPVAAALGIELTTQVTSAVSAYRFRRGDGCATVDGIQVQLAAYTQLTEDEVNAVRTEQDQAATGGES